MILIHFPWEPLFTSLVFDNLALLISWILALIYWAALDFASQHLPSCTKPYPSTITSWSWPFHLFLGRPRLLHWSNVTYMLLLNCALKLVEEIILYSCMSHNCSTIGSPTRALVNGRILSEVLKDVELQDHQLYIMDLKLWIIARSA